MTSLSTGHATIGPLLGQGYTSRNIQQETRNNRKEKNLKEPIEEREINLLQSRYQQLTR